MGGHAIDSVATGGVRSSASSEARNAAVARFSLDLKVPDRDVEDDRRFAIGQAKVVMDDEDCTLLGGQPAEATFQLIAQDGRTMRVGSPGHVDAGRRRSP